VFTDSAGIVGQKLQAQIAKPPVEVVTCTTFVHGARTLAFISEIRVLAAPVNPLSVRKNQHCCTWQ